MAAATGQATPQSEIPHDAAAGVIGPRPALAGEWSDSARRVLRERYLWKRDGAFLEDEEGMCWRVSTAVAAAESAYGGDVTGAAADFYGIMVRGQFLPNSPTLMNAGKGNGLQLSACFVLPVEDTIESIFDAVKYAAIVHKSGGGTGFAFSRLRPEGSTVGTSQGVASGPVSFMRIFDAATEQVKQGGTRRGANMGILRVDHPDIEKFITCKLDGGITNFNISVAATEAFMRAVEADGEYDLVAPDTGAVVATRRAREVWGQIVDAAWRSGDPGLVFIDRANESRSNPTPDVEIIEATNPCVTGDTLVYTAVGVFPIADLHARAVAPHVTLDTRMLNGVYGPATAPFVTGIKPVYRLTTTDGYEVRLTADHRVRTEKRGWVAARDLLAGDKLLLLDHKGGFGTEGDEGEGRVVGWLIGDGHIKQYDRVGNAVAYLEFWGDERELASAFAGYVSAMVPPHPLKGMSAVGVTAVEERNLLRVGSSRLARILAAEFGITHDTKIAGLPTQTFAKSEAFQRGLLQALFTADGHVSGTAAKGVSVRLTSISLPLLRDVQRMLLNFGVACRIYAERHPERDVTIRERTYRAHADHDLVIARDNVLRFAREIGFLSETKREGLIRALGTYGKRGPYREQFVATFAALTYEGEETVYDLTEPLTHSFVANGLVVHNCGEQWLGPFDACNLGSINLAAVTTGEGDAVAIDWVELERVTRVAVRFLDDVIDINPLPLPQIEEKVRANRRIGLGVMGWADLLFRMGLPYDSDAALALSREIMAKVQAWGWDASRALAAERGPFPNFERSIFAGEAPVRNANVTTVAPTGSISIIAGCSSGIEPVFALAFQHRVRQGDSYRVLNFVNPVFRAEMGRRGLWSDELEAHLVRTGSAKDAPGVPEEVQRVYVTAQEIAPEWHVRQQAAWQENVDNSISKCLAAGTLIPTSRGLLAVEDFSDVDEPDTFVNIADEGITANGHRVLSHYYAGAKPATRIRLDNGAELIGSTESHRVYTTDGWQRLSDLRPGELVVGKFAVAHGAGGMELPPLGSLRANARHVTVPARMSPQLALFLGMIAADGHTQETTGAVGLTSVSDDALALFDTLAGELFGLAPRPSVDTRNGVQYRTLTSRALCRWVRGLIGEGAYSKRVPPHVLGGSAGEKLAFLRGISLDGYHRPNHGLYLYAGMSAQLAYGVAEMCRSFGLPLVRQERANVAYSGNTAHKVVASNEMQELLSCIEPHKNGPVHFATYQVLVDHEVVAQTKLPTKHPYYSVLRAMKQRQARTCDNRTASRLDWPSWPPVHRVTAVEEAGVLPLYDIEVEDAHAYVVNGIVSHNTVNLPNGATRDDVADAYTLAYDLGCKGITVFRDGSKGEQVLNIGGGQQPAASSQQQAEEKPAEERHAARGTRHAARPAGGRIKPRPEVVRGYTRAMTAPEGKVNITVNSDADGPLEVFVTIGRAGSDIAAMAEGIGRLISLNLRMPSDLSQDEKTREIANQLRGIGGSRAVGFGPAQVRSLPDAVGKALLMHYGESPTNGHAADTDAAGAAPAPASHMEDDPGAGRAIHTLAAAMVQTPEPSGNLCPNCGSAAFVFEEGCKKCHSCGYSEC